MLEFSVVRWLRGHIYNRQRGLSVFKFIVLDTIMVVYYNTTHEVDKFHSFTIHHQLSHLVSKYTGGLGIKQKHIIFKMILSIVTVK